MGASLIGAIEQLLKLGNLAFEERHRYDDNLLRLRKEWYEEFDKLETDQGSDNRLDDITDELRLTLDSVVEAIRAKNA
jgi:polyhydroxyalkanoate synthesis regulator phasin